MTDRRTRAFPDSTQPALSKDLETALTARQDSTRSEQNWPRRRLRTALSVSTLTPGPSTSLGMEEWGPMRWTSTAKRSARNLLARLGRQMLGFLDPHRLEEIPAVDKATQLLLALHYRQLLRERAPLPSFDEVQFRAFSQNGEDGILLFLFSLLGTTNKRSVELGVANGTSCNTANLILNHGWTALLVDAALPEVEEGRRFYSQHPDTAGHPPAFLHAWVTRENVNDVVQGAGFRGEIDLLSLDLDGNDYWIWEALDCISPRVVVLEYRTVWGAERAVTIPYRPDFVADAPDYAGASLPAFVKLAAKKGYRLVGCERLCFNAFFLRDGVGEELFPEIPASACFNHPAAQHQIAHRQALVAGREWVEV